VTINAPGPHPTLVANRALVDAGATFALALACLVVGFGSDSTTERVGLLAAGIFAALALVSDAAIAAAVTTLAVAPLFVAAGTLQRPETIREAREHAAVLVVTLGIVASLTAAAGLAPAGLRKPGTVLALAGLVAIPACCDADRTDWIVGLPAGAFVLAAGLHAPFVSGAVLLVAGDVVGASLGLVALATVGCVAALSAGLRRGYWAAAVGAPLLLVVGVPASVQSALGATLALALLSGVTR
jgi:hypothetical protein